MIRHFPAKPQHPGEALQSKAADTFEWRKKPGGTGVMGLGLGFRVLGLGFILKVSGISDIVEFVDR